MLPNQLLKAEGDIIQSQEAQFIVPDCGDKVDYDIGLKEYMFREKGMRGGEA